MAETARLEALRDLHRRWGEVENPTDVGLWDLWAEMEALLKRREVWDEVAAERARAHAKHGDTSMESAPPDDSVGRRLRVLLEEVGEVAKEFNDAENERRPVDRAKLRAELIQVAAMAGAWADALTRSVAAVPLGVSDIRPENNQGAQT